jgi:DNA-binding Xre family transcriptional regulator
MYNYFLGGRDNFPADRLAAEKALSVVPDGRRIALANRYFLAQATLRMADRGITQFLDLGTGIPTSPAVHEVAREINPLARMAYVDNDPVVIAHNKAQLAAIETVRVVHGDIRQPEAVLADPAIRSLLDFSQPVGLLCVAVLHFITDDEDPGRIVATFADELAPGSYLALSHISSDGTGPEAITTIRDAYANAAAPAVFRSAAQIRAFFDGFAWEPPGLIDVVDWFPYSKVFTATPPTVQVLGGLGCKNLPRLPCLIPDLDSPATPEAVQDRSMTSLPGRWRAAFSRRILAGSFSGAPTAANSGPIPPCPSRGAPSSTPPTRTRSRPESARPGSASSHSPVLSPTDKEDPLMPANSSPVPRARPSQPCMFPIDGARLRALRQERGLSQEVLAERAGISLTTVARLERRYRVYCRGRTLARLSAALGEDPSALTPR